MWLMTDIGTIITIEFSVRSVRPKRGGNGVQKHGNALFEFQSQRLLLKCFLVSCYSIAQMRI